MNIHRKIELLTAKHADTEHLHGMEPSRDEFERRFALISMLQQTSIRGENLFGVNDWSA